MRVFIMPSVKVLRAMVASGQHLEAGKVYDLKEIDALKLFRMGRAVPFSEPVPEVDNREKDLKTTKRSTAKKTTTKKLSGSASVKKTTTAKKVVSKES